VDSSPDVEGDLGKAALQACLDNLQSAEAELASKAAQTVYLFFSYQRPLSQNFTGLSLSLLMPSVEDEVVNNIAKIVNAIPKASSECRGFLGATCSRVARKGFVAPLIAAGGIQQIGTLLRDTDADVVTTALEALSQICEAGDDFTGQVDSSLGFKTFTELLAKSEDEIKAGSLYLISHVARLRTSFNCLCLKANNWTFHLASTRSTILADKALVQVILDGLAVEELAGGSAAALQALSLSGPPSLSGKSLKTDPNLPIHRYCPNSSS